MILAPPLLPSELHNPNLPVTDPMDVSALNITDFDLQTPIPIDPDVDSRKKVDPITHSVPTNSLIQNSHAAQVRAHCRREIYKELATNGALAPKYPQHGMVLSVPAFSHYISRVATSVLPPDHIIDDQFQWCDVCCIYFSRDNATSHKLAEDYNRKFESNQKNLNTDRNATSHKLGEEYNRRFETIQKNMYPDPNATGQNPGEDNNRGCEDNADPFPRCEVCNIHCTDKYSLDEHKKGKKHLRKLLASGSMKTPEKNKEAGADKIKDKTQEMKNETATESQVLGVDSGNQTCKIIESNADGIEPTYSDDLENKKLSILEGDVVALPENIRANELEGVRIRLRDDRSDMCEICNISLPNSNSAHIIMHNAGKKHLQNMAKLGKKETDTSALVTTDLCPGLTQCPGVVREETEGLKKGSATESQVRIVDSENKKRKIIECDASVGNRIDRVSCKVLEDKKQKIMESYLEKKELSEVLPEDTKNTDPTKIMADPLEEVRNIDCPSESLLVEPRRKRRRRKVLKNNMKIAACTSASTHAPVTSDTSTPATTLLMHGPTKNTELIQDKTEMMKNENATESQVLEVDSGNKTCKIIESNADGIEPTFSDDLENKKQSILEGDVVALPENIRANELEGVCIRLRDDRSAMCEICNISLANSNSANIIRHNTGKKHLKKMAKLGMKETDTSALVTTDLCPGLTKCPGVIHGETEGLKKGSATESQVPRVDSENRKRKISEGDAAVVNQMDRVSCEVLENKKQKIMERYAEKNELLEVLPEDTKNSYPTKVMADPLEEVRNIDCPSHSLLVEPRRKKRQFKMLKNNMKIAACNSASTHTPVTSGPLIIAEVSQVSKNENAILSEGFNNEFVTDSQALEMKKLAVKKEIRDEGVCNKPQRSWFRNPLDEWSFKFFDKTR